MFLTGNARVIPVRVLLQLMARLALLIASLEPPRQAVPGLAKPPGTTRHPSPRRAVVGVGGGRVAVPIRKAHGTPRRKAPGRPHRNRRAGSVLRAVQAAEAGRMRHLCGTDPVRVPPPLSRRSLRADTPSKIAST